MFLSWFSDYPHYSHCVVLFLMICCI